MKENQSVTDQYNGSAVVIGASLSGLMTGIALAKEGLTVTILEKVVDGPRSGAGLQVDAAGFTSKGTERLLRNLASGGKRSIQLWTSIESRLRKEVESDARIDLRYDSRVEVMEQNETAAWVITDRDEKFQGDIVIGADGHHSKVRKIVAPDNPNAIFAGYMVWIASTNEMDLTEHLRPGYNHPEVTMLNSSSGFLFGSIIESADSSEERRIGCTWYDNTHNDVLRELGCVKDGIVHHSLNGEDIPEDTLQQLASKAANRWPAPWSFSILHAINTRNIIGIPIKEYIPDYLVKDRIALIGDAAHVPAPITASGFNASLDDAVELGKCAAKGVQGSAGIKTLKKYESGRLKKVRRMVESGNSFSQSFGRP